MSLDLMNAMDDIDCAQCADMHWTCRVTATDGRGGIVFSTYACPLCVHRRAHLVRAVHPEATVHPLPGKAHQPSFLEQEAML